MLIKIKEMVKVGFHPHTGHLCGFIPTQAICVVFVGGGGGWGGGGVLKNFLGNSEYSVIGLFIVQSPH